MCGPSWAPLAYTRHFVRVMCLAGLKRLSESCVARLMLAYEPAGTGIARLPVIVSKIDLFMCIFVLEAGEGGS